MIASTRHTVILLAILAAITFATYAANAKRPSGGHVNRTVLYLSIAGGEWLLARYTTSGLRGITARELIGSFRWWDVPLAVAFYFVSQAVLFGIQRALGPGPDRIAGLTPTTLGEKIAWVVVAVTAGIVEELVFRGYLQRQFIAWSRSAAAGIVIQAIVFAAAHAYQGIKPTITIAVYALFFGLLAHFRRGLVPGMLAHAATDVIGGLFVR